MSTATKSKPAKKPASKKKGDGQKLKGKPALAWAVFSSVVLGGAAWYLGWYAPEHVARMDSENAITNAAIWLVEQCASAPLVVAGVAAGLVAVCAMMKKTKLYLISNVAALAVLGFCFWALGSPLEGIQESIDGALGK